jgi:hypothetical protein
MRTTPIFLLSLVLSFLVTGCGSSEPTCDDAAHYNEQVNELSTEALNEDSMNEYVEARKNLAAAEEDCAKKGERPSY